MLLGWEGGRGGGGLLGIGGFAVALELLHGF